MFKFYVLLRLVTFLCSIWKYRWQKLFFSIKNRSYFLCNLAAKAKELGLANHCTMLELCFCSDLRNQKVEDSFSESSSPFASSISVAVESNAPWCTAGLDLLWETIEMWLCGSGCLKSCHYYFYSIFWFSSLPMNSVSHTERFLQIPFDLNHPEKDYIS